METHSYTVALLVYTAKESYLWLYRMCLPCFSLLKKKGLHNYTMKKLTVSKHFSQKECLMNNHKTPLMLKSREKEDRISLGKKNTRYIHQTPPPHTPSSISAKLHQFHSLFWSLPGHARTQLSPLLKVSCHTDSKEIRLSMISKKQNPDMEPKVSEAEQECSQWKGPTAGV